MLNEEIVLAIKDEFGLTMAIDYCLMQAHASKLQALDFEERNPGEPNEFRYDYEWYISEYTKLTKEKGIADVRTETIPQAQSIGNITTVS